MTNKEIAAAVRAIADSIEGNSEFRISWGVDTLHQNPDDPERPFLIQLSTSKMEPKK